MRFDKEIKFVKLGKTEYNAETGNYDEPYTEETKVFANVTSAGTNTLTMVYGNIKQNALVIRIQNHHKEPFDYIKYDNKRYRVDFMRKLNNLQAFIVSEVQ